MVQDNSPGAPLPNRPRRWTVHLFLRVMLAIHAAAVAFARRVMGPPRAVPASGRQRILLTGTFYSANWAHAHIRPLATSRRCEHLWVVTTFPLPPTPNVTAIHPPAWLLKVAGNVPARLLTFCVAAFRLRPHLLGGFHMLINGLVADLLAKMVRARAVYFCVGGPPEVIDGGIWSDNKLFTRMTVADAVVERRLVAAAGDFDLIVTMGTRAKVYFREHGASCAIHVVSGGMDQTLFAAGQPAERKQYDLILVGRLAEIKRIDVFLEALALIARERRKVRAAIVGDGELRRLLERMVEELGIAENVHFAGLQSDVGAWLRQSRIFVLTSDSEGLSLSLMEAMTAGLPAVVSDVGDLGDLVEQGRNGFLVPRRSPARFAARILELLEDERKLAAFSDAAKSSAAYHESSAVTRRWDEILDEVSSEK